MFSTSIKNVSFRETQPIFTTVISVQFAGFCHCLKKHSFIIHKQTSIAESRAKAMLRDEFLINMQKFASSIVRTLQQIEGEVKLEVPDVDIPEDIEAVLANRELTELIHDKCADWARQIQVF